jgi:MoxR-like ATPase
VSILGFEFEVQNHVNQENCLTFPVSYRVPTYGGLATDLESILVALTNQRSLYVWGPPGTGKDAFFHAFSHLTRTPALLFQITPGADIQSWFFTRAFSAEGTFWEEGALLKALSKGCPTAKGPVPYLILLSDFDRADISQAETLRLIMDSITGRVMGPGGVSYPVFPGTVIVATANTPGGGDFQGRYISSNAIDPSLLDRFDRKVKIRRMDWRDENLVVQSKFPQLHAEFPDLLESIAPIAMKLRLAIDDGVLLAEFSHRSVCSVLGHAQDTHKSRSQRNLPALSSHALLKLGFRIWLDGLPDLKNREAADKILDPYLRGGTLDEGDTSHIKGALPLPSFFPKG